MILVLGGFPLSQHRVEPRFIIHYPIYLPLDNLIHRFLSLIDPLFLLELGLHFCDVLMSKVLF
jgi:hypothetical protein